MPPRHAKLGRVCRSERQRAKRARAVWRRGAVERRLGWDDGGDAQEQGLARAGHWAGGDRLGVLQRAFGPGAGGTAEHGRAVDECGWPGFRRGRRAVPARPAAGAGGGPPQLSAPDRPPTGPAAGDRRGARALHPGRGDRPARVPALAEQPASAAGRRPARHRSRAGSQRPRDAELTAEPDHARGPPRRDARGGQGDRRRPDVEAHAPVRPDRRPDQRPGGHGTAGIVLPAARLGAGDRLGHRPAGGPGGGVDLADR